MINFIKETLVIVSRLQRDRILLIDDQFCRIRRICIVILQHADGGEPVLPKDLEADLRQGHVLIDGTDPVIWHVPVAGDNLPAVNGTLT